MPPEAGSSSETSKARIAPQARALGLDEKWWVLIAVGTGTFMSALDISVVNTILPVINQELVGDVATIEWVVVVYLLVVSGLLPGFGRLGDLRGHKLVYIGGFVVFVLSSVLCGLAPTVLALIIFRGLQSLGAAMLSANSPAILTKAFPDVQRGQALGLQATMTYLGLTVGPSLGGFLTDHFGWRTVFYINIPVGILALMLSLRFIRSDKPAIAREPFDWRGAALFMSGLICLLLGLNQGHNWGWTSPSIWSLLLGALVLLTSFLYTEMRVLTPMLDLKLFRSKVFSASIISAILNYICVYGIIFLMPFYLIQGRGMSPSQAGLLLSAQPIIMAIVAPISGTLSDRIGVRIPSTLGMSILAIGLYLLTRISAVTTTPMLALSLAVTGLGIGIFISPNNSALMGSAPRNRQGIAAGLMATARNVGMVLGVGLAGAIFNTSIAHSQLSQPDSLYPAVQMSLSILIGIAVIGILTSATRGNNLNSESERKVDHV